MRVACHFVFACRRVLILTLSVVERASFLFNKQLDIESASPDDHKDDENQGNKCAAGIENILANFFFWRCSWN